MSWLVLSLLDTSHRWQPLLSLGKYLQSIWLIMQEMQRKIQREAALEPHEADPSGKAWKNSPWPPSGMRVVPATVQQADLRPLPPAQPRLLGLFLRAPLHGWADRGERAQSVGKSLGSGDKLPGFRPQLCHLLAV